MSTTSAKTEMLAHSLAKVELYKRYLSVYLQILSRVKHVRKIFLFDFFCGEGIYEDGAKGSPVVTMDVIKEHYESNNNRCPDMEIWFNDLENSKIENDKLKIDRVKDICSPLFCPSNVSIRYSNKDYTELFGEALHLVTGYSHAKSIFFIDPYGYKLSHPEDIRKVMLIKDAELILFLPTSHMYRFAEKAVDNDSFAGGTHLRKFLFALFDERPPIFTSVYEFIDKLKVQFRSYLSSTKSYVDTFLLERDASNVYCLFFFSNHVLGAKKMLEAKWKLDEEQGRGFRIESRIASTMSLFSPMDLSDYPEKLWEYIQSSPAGRTNRDIFEFGLINGYLEKHSNEVLNVWKKEGRIAGTANDNQPIKGNYIGNNKRRVTFSVQNRGSLKPTE